MTDQRRPSPLSPGLRRAAAIIGARIESVGGSDETLRALLELQADLLEEATESDGMIHSVDTPEESETR